METPICDFVNAYRRLNAERFHMPGHKGKPFLGPEALDITEISGAGVLYGGEDIIAQSEKNASALFGSAKTLYSTEGSSLCIRAMLWMIRLFALSRGRRPRIAAARNAHKSFVLAAALMDIEIVWLFGRQADLLSCPLDPEETAMLLKEVHPDALYITSPDYLGNLADVRALSAVCRREGCLLAVDNAHGAYLKWMPGEGALSLHPLDAGADLCCDSAHKTLPVLTGGAYLHIGTHAPAFFLREAERAMSLFASTSPSYLILQSLDLCSRFLAEEARVRLAETAEAVGKLAEELRASGWKLKRGEPLRLCILPKEMGIRGDELDAFCRTKRLYGEFSDPDVWVLMFSAATEPESLRRLKEVLGSLPRREAIKDVPPPLPVPRQLLSPSEAIQRESERVPLSRAEGRILAAPAASCPPAVSAAVCGELLDAEVLTVCRYYGMEELDVVKGM